MWNFSVVCVGYDCDRVLTCLALVPDYLRTKLDLELESQEQELEVEVAKLPQETVQVMSVLPCAANDNN